MLQVRQRVGAGDADLPHVPEIEETRGGSHRAMFVDHATVLDRHQPAGKRDETGPQLLMTTSQRGFAQSRVLRFVFVVTCGHSSPFRRTCS